MCQLPEISVYWIATHVVVARNPTHMLGPRFMLVHYYSCNLCFERGGWGATHESASTLKQWLVLMDGVRATDCKSKLSQQWATHRRLCRSVMLLLCINSLNVAMCYCDVTLQLFAAHIVNDSQATASQLYQRLRRCCPFQRLLQVGY